MATWETLKAKSSIESVYLPCLKLAITTGSFIMYENKVLGDATVLQVGRVLQVVKTIDMVPGSADRFQAIRQEAAVHVGNASRGNDIPLQFIQINVFKTRDSFAEEDFAVDGDNSVLLSSAADGGWQYLVQMEEDDWILADSIINLSFVFPEEEVSSHRHDDCRGMFNFFVLKHRCARNGSVSCIPKLACPPPFGGQLEGFDQYWSVDHCQVIFVRSNRINTCFQRHDR
jgi:hypothetical protein